MRLRGPFEDHVYPADSVRAGDVDHVFRDDAGTVYLITGADVAGPTSEAIWVLAVEAPAV